MNHKPKEVICAIATRIRCAGAREGTARLRSNSCPNRRMFSRRTRLLTIAFPLSLMQACALTHEGDLGADAVSSAAEKEASGSNACEIRAIWTYAGRREPVDAEGNLPHIDTDWHLAYTITAARAPRRSQAPYAKLIVRLKATHQDSNDEAYWLHAELNLTGASGATHEYKYDASEEQTLQQFRVSRNLREETYTVRHLSKIGGVNLAARRPKGFAEKNRVIVPVAKCDRLEVESAEAARDEARAAGARFITNA